MPIDQTVNQVIIYRLINVLPLDQKSLAGHKEYANIVEEIIDKIHIKLLS
jgi:hypothetical protein